MLTYISSFTSKLNTLLPDVDVLSNKIVWVVVSLAGLPELIWFAFWSNDFISKTYPINPKVSVSLLSKLLAKRGSPIFTLEKPDAVFVVCIDACP